MCSQHLLAFFKVSSQLPPYTTCDGTPEVVPGCNGARSTPSLVVYKLYQRQPCAESRAAAHAKDNAPPITPRARLAAERTLQGLAFLHSLVTPAFPPDNQQFLQKPVSSLSAYINFLCVFGTSAVVARGTPVDNDHPNELTLPANSLFVLLLVVLALVCGCGCALFTLMVSGEKTWRISDDPRRIVGAGRAGGRGRGEGKAHMDECMRTRHGAEWAETEHHNTKSRDTKNPHQLKRQTVISGQWA